jgi:hypothetical protein
MTFEEIAKVFEDQGYTWKFKDGTRVPTAMEIHTTTFQAIDALADEPDNSQIEVGRLIIKKHGSWYDLFVHLAEFQ